MNQRIRMTLFTPLMACSLAIGAAATGWAATPKTAPAAAPAAPECFVEAKAGDATKAIVSGEGWDKAKGKVFLDQTDGTGAGSGTVGDDGKFTSGDVPAGKYTAFQNVQGGGKATCLGGQAAQDAINQKLITAERQRGAKEGFTDGKALAQAGTCDAEPKLNNNQNFHGLVPNAAGKKEAKEAHDQAYTAAFDSALKRYCTD